MSHFKFPKKYLYNVKHAIYSTTHTLTNAYLKVHAVILFTLY